MSETSLNAISWQYYFEYPAREQRILCVTHTVEHNYILFTSTVNIQLHVSALYVGHLQVEILYLQISYTRCVGRLGRWEERTRSRCFNSGYRDPGLLQIHL